MSKLEEMRAQMHAQRRYTKPEGPGAGDWIEVLDELGPRFWLPEKLLLEYNAEVRRQFGMED